MSGEVSSFKLGYLPFIMKATCLVKTVCIDNCVLFIVWIFFVFVIHLCAYIWHYNLFFFVFCILSQKHGLIISVKDFCLLHWLKLDKRIGARFLL